MKYNYTTTPENGPTLKNKVVEFAKEERIGNEFIDEAGYVYTLVSLNPDDNELYVTTSTHPKLRGDCRWSAQMVEQIIKTSKF